MKRVRYKKTDPLMTVEIPKLLGLYHVAWSRFRGVVGRCKSIDFENKTVVLVNPKTKKEWSNPVRWADLRLTRAAQTKLKTK